MKGHISAQSRVWGELAEATALRTLNKFAIDLISIPNEEDLFWYVAQNVVGQLNFVDCVIYQANNEQTELRQVAAWGEKNPFGRSIVNPLLIPFGRGITGTVAVSKKAMIVDDLLNDNKYIVDTQVARSEICVPFFVNGNVVGVIDSEHPNANAFADAELEILSTVAAITGAKLELLAEARRSAQRYEGLLNAHAELIQETATRKSLETQLFEARKLESVGRLTGKFAHEFNNLSTTILGNLELLSMEELPRESSLLLGAAQTAAEMSAQLVRNMLAFAQRTRLTPSVVNLNNLIVDYYDTTITSLSRGLDLDLAKDLLPLSADPSAIKTILFHLIKNAQDSVFSGGSIQISTKNVLQTCLDRDNLGSTLLAGSYVQLAVTDTGQGIPKERLSQIFDPFFTTKTIGSGSGLGLSIVQGLVKQSGGHVAVRSELGEGSTFEVTLPAFTELESKSSSPNI